MLSNKEIANFLKLTGQLMELHGENPFRTRSYSSASFKIGRMEQPLSGLNRDEIEKTEGLGKTIAGHITEMCETGNCTFLQELVGNTPSGVVELLSIKGIGPKKIRSLWKELGIESIGELLYACNENRLVDLKGFGAKTQDTIKKNIEFRISNEGKFHFAAVEEWAESLVELLKMELETDLVSLTGEMRRKCEIIHQIDVLIGSEKPIAENLFDLRKDIAIQLHTCAPESFPFELFKSTGANKHLAQLNLTGLEKASSEEEIYQANELPFIIPEMREGRDEFEWAKIHREDEIIEYNDLKGILHNHSTWSDGTDSIRNMANWCIENDYEYLGISDHSQTAVYAGGLQPDRVLAQHEEIEKLNDELAPFKIFKGIESDILSDGSLDYDTEILKHFDFVVASIHSGFKMDVEKATARLIKAIENPYTTILGHPTGRLLLSREGYPINHRKIIDACAANNVVIEINANPFRLDIDWRWIPYAMKKSVMISINPDAHSKEAFQHMYYGWCVARKGGLTKESTFNALSLLEIDNYLKR